MASFFSRTKSISARERASTRTSSSTTQSGHASGGFLSAAMKNTFGAGGAGQTNGVRPGGSSMASRTTVDDPVSMHLLMETAMHDSAEYGVMAPEEVDGLKRQLENLQGRIEATERKLAMESKARDAALSLTKLDQGGDPSEGREAAKKCDNLSRELRQMDKEYQTMQRRLMEHTAGVLQMTHKGYTKDMSVASLTTGSTLPDDDFDDFDMNSGLYKPYMGDFEDGIIDIGGAGSGGGSMSKEQKQILHNVEAKVEKLNGNMRDMMTRLDSRAGPPAQARSLRDDPDNPIEVLLEQVNALEQCVASIQEVQARQLHFVNQQLYEAITGDSSGATSPTYAAPPQDDDLPDQIAYTSNGIGKLKHLTNHMGQTVSKSGQKIEDLDQYNSVLNGLWELLNTDVDGNSRLSSSNAFSLQAFNSKVQATHGKVNSLEQQKEVLTRQIQQQRELNASSDEAKEKKFSDMTERTEHLEGEVARLQTELTMAKAELDGAYGTRAQRKAEAAADPVLTARVATLEKELSETITDYEKMTKSTIEYEKEREGLEATIDGMRDKVDQLETALSEQKIGMMGGGAAQGNKTPATPGAEGGGRAAGVLRAEFKKLMKETKAEHAKKLKEELDERRKLEATIRGFRNEKSSKSPVAKAAA